MIRIWLIILLSLTSSNIVSGLDKVNEELLAHVKACKTDFETVTDLHAYLVQPATNKREEAELFFYWIAENIAYDINKFKMSLSGEYPSSSNILVSKAGVCSDYSKLFKSLCDISAIECYDVSGYAKGFGYDANTELKIIHAWNIVNIDSSYQFLDCTWGSGHVKYNTSGDLEYVKKMNLKNAFVTSDAFRETHLPGSPKWQLLPLPISVKNFSKFDKFDEMVLHDADFEFNYVDSIQHFKRLDSLDQIITEWKSIYQFNPTSANAYLLGIYYENSAYFLSDGNFERNKFEKAKWYYQRAKKCYEKYIMAQERSDDELKDQYVDLIIGANARIAYCDYRLRAGK